MQKSPSLPTILNKNVQFVDNPIFWIFYILLIFFLRVIIAGIGIDGLYAWTYINIMHTTISFLLFHWIKGSPLVDDHQQFSRLTFWEQIDDSLQYTRARKFLTVVPIAIFIIAADSTNWELAIVWINLLFTFIAVIAKLPFMHGVRIFGINR